jgi:ATP-dependent DNA helicase RecG
MKILSLDEIIRLRETQTIELKKSLSLQDKGLEALCAMVNTETAYGVVAFGIESNGIVCGIEPGNLDTAQQKLSQTIRNKFEPPIIVQIKIDETKGKPVLLLHATRNNNIAYHEYDGRAWIREGTTNRILSLSEKEAFTKYRNRDNYPGPWKCDKCGTWVGVLNSFLISAEGMKKTYKCHCGGEFWPIK